jgi:hypothetical protein
MDHIDDGSILELIEECRNEPDIDKRIEILFAINSILPQSQQLKIPSLITNDYINVVLYRIQETLLVA